ncbi:hypothetical protein, partial [Acidovorax sp.]|uniref:hypothetical protein n=1 Tax=Acidovorax sp. TaxID=1872122 RepID=UPI00391F3714
MPRQPRHSKVDPPTELQIQLFRLPEVPEPYKKAVEVVHSKPHAPCQGPDHRTAEQTRTACAHSTAANSGVGSAVP